MWGMGRGMGVDPDGLEEWTCWAMSKAFVGGLGQGFLNIGNGLLKTGKEITYQGRDIAVGSWEVGANLLGYNKRYSSWSESGNALESGSISYGGYYGHTSANVVTFGTWGQANTAYHYYQGNISATECSERMGSTGVLQLTSAYVMKQQGGIWTRPVQKVPRDVLNIARGAARGEISLSPMAANRWGRDPPLRPLHQGGSH